MRQLIEQRMTEAVDSDELLNAMWWYASSFGKMKALMNLLARSKSGVGMTKADYKDYKQHYNQTHDDNDPVDYDDWLTSKLEALRSDDISLVAKKFLKKLPQGPPGSMAAKRTTFTPESLVALYKKEER